ncbi:hypothetical protein A2Z33_03880 [Candidatus Gottesmanbacteria bacterium RBG_16_52_11]|uniref:Glycosyltransferase RgtA/B/C/D-like domain-containing protein n=1 Tax=Candidatus Gottesmanbacteria bacterium RBG_16_52_11 TaxID=1798374 RepID=A0A1F5YVP6_9BACT|nr:MAG: hypothetical protein A2Z33_03880 [Candidatus Gottesmanbacteria bacterium RBG_16_52_11]
MFRINAPGFIAVSLAVSAGLIAVISRLEPAVHQALAPGMREIESFLYLFGLGIFTLILPAVLLRLPAGTSGHPETKSGIFALYGIIVAALLAVILWIRYFFVTLQPTASFAPALFDMGIFAGNNYVTPGEYLFAVIIAAAILLLLVPRLRLNRTFKILLHGGSVLLIFWLTTGINKLNFYDYTHYAGPVHDLLEGQPLLQSRSWYGFLSVVTLSTIFRFIPLTVTNLHLVFAGIQFSGFVLLYVLFQLLLRDWRWASVSTVYAIFANHLVKIGAPYEFPQQSFWRMGIWLPVAILIYLENRFPKSGPLKTRHLTTGVIAVALLWTLDFGLYTLIAYTAYLWISHSGRTLAESLKNTLSRVIPVLACAFGTALLISLAGFLVSGVWPMWIRHYAFIGLYFASSFALPFPQSPYPWIMILVPAGATGYLIYRMRKTGHLSPVEKTVLFTAAAGLANFLYFTGSSHLNGLHALSLPFLVCAFYLLKTALDGLRSGPKPALAMFILVAAALLALPGTYLYKQGTANLEYANPVTTLRFITGPAENEFTYFGPTADSIRKSYGSDIAASRFAILSVWDTWYLILLKTRNSLGHSCLACYLTEESPDPFIDAVHKSPARHLFVDADRFQHNGRVARLFSLLRQDLSYVETLGLLEVYELRIAE